MSYSLRRFLFVAFVFLCSPTIGRAAEPSLFQPLDIFELEYAG